MTRLGALAVMLVLLASLAAHEASARHRRRRPPPPPLQRTPVTLLHLVDADTAYLRLRDGRVVHARFAGVNAPECHKRQVRLRGGRRSARCTSDDEPFGLAAYRRALQLLRSGRPIVATCERTRRGRCKSGGYGRALAYLEVGGVDVARTLIAEGLAWTFTRYPSARRAAYCAAESRARAAGRGMWRRPVSQVLARAHAKTRRWYAQHDALCRRARARRSARKPRRSRRRGGR